MDVIKEKYLKQMWETLKMLNMDSEPSNIREILPNTEMYKDEISLMIRLRQLLRLPNAYKYLNNYIKENPNKIPLIIENATENVKKEKKPLTLEYCGCLFSAKVREIEIKEIDTRPTKIYIPRKEREDDEER